jgi:hypothetical protein
MIQIKNKLLTKAIENADYSVIRFWRHLQQNPPARHAAVHGLFVFLPPLRKRASV